MQLDGDGGPRFGQAMVLVAGAALPWPPGRLGRPSASASRSSSLAQPPSQRRCPPTGSCSSPMPRSPWAKILWPASASASSSPPSPATPWPLGARRRPPHADRRRRPGPWGSSPSHAHRLHVQTGPSHGDLRHSGNRDHVLPDAVVTTVAALAGVEPPSVSSPVALFPASR